jgi:hypothetical protein
MTQSGHNDTEIPQCSRLLPYLKGGVLSFGRLEPAAPPRFRTIQVWPEDLPASLWQAEVQETGRTGRLAG